VGLSSTRSLPCSRRPRVRVERFIYLHRVARGNRRLWAQLAPLIKAGNFRKAMEIAEKTESALSTVMRYGMSRIATAQRREDIEKAMEESLIEVIPHLEKRTHYLATLANVGMLMGLLGTVIGLINAFAAVAAVNPAEKAAMLSASISVAMNNTALASASRSRCCCATCTSRPRPRSWWTASRSRRSSS